MSHFAKIENGIVTQVIVAEQKFINTLDGEWVETSYTTYGGRNPEGNPLRKNYAGIGYSYDLDKDAFIPPKEFDSWILNDDTCLWEPPILYPDDGNEYEWDDESRSWVEVSG